LAVTEYTINLGHPIHEIRYMDQMTRETIEIKLHSNNIRSIKECRNPCQRSDCSTCPFRTRTNPGLFPPSSATHFHTPHLCHIPHYSLSCDSSFNLILFPPSLYPLPVPSISLPLVLYFITSLLCFFLLFHFILLHPHQFRSPSRDPWGLSTISFFPSFPTPSTIASLPHLIATLLLIWSAPDLHNLTDSCISSWLSASGLFLDWQRPCTYSTYFSLYIPM
jgi:hypothetical protein